MRRRRRAWQGAPAADRAPRTKHSDASRPETASSPPSSVPEPVARDEGARSNSSNGRGLRRLNTPGGQGGALRAPRPPPRRRRAPPLDENRARERERERERKREAPRGRLRVDQRESGRESGFERENEREPDGNGHAQTSRRRRQVRALQGEGCRPCRRPRRRESHLRRPRVHRAGWRPSCAGHLQVQRTEGPRRGMISASLDPELAAKLGSLPTRRRHDVVHHRFGTKG